MAYAATFFLTPYNQLYFSGQSGYDDTDLPYTLAIVECVVTGSTFIIGALAFATAKNPPRRVILTALLFFIVAVVLQGTFGVIRAWNLGLVGDDMTRTCSDEGMTGCPTTRFEVKNGRDIMFKEPYGGQCSFWFWGPSFKARYEGKMPGSTYGSSCAGWKEFSGDCDEEIEKNMDWTKATSYGWRDDMSDIGPLLDDTTGAVTIKKVHNMQILHSLQATVIAAKNSSIPSEARYSSQPSIAYCWYWGCSEVCNSHRFWVNRWWLFSSVALTVLHIINAIMAVSLWRQLDPSVQPIKNIKAGIDVENNVVGNEFMVQPVGRRRRVQNPSGLLF
jgi:hypothetical protein